MNIPTIIGAYPRFTKTNTAIESLENQGFCSEPVKMRRPCHMIQEAALLLAEKAVALAVGCLPENSMLAALQRAENADDSERWAEFMEADSYQAFTVKASERSAEREVKDTDQVYVAGKGSRIIVQTLQEEVAV